MKKSFRLIICFILLMILSGCLYPQSERIKNSGPIDVHIASVEDAVERFFKATGVYPIINSTINTPIYEKYIIDMGKLYPQYLGYLPENSFEKGGSYKYTIVNIEQAPQVKLIDLTISSEVQTMQRLINEYKLKHDKYPFGKSLSETMYSIDYNALKISPPTVISPYTGKGLTLILSKNGEVMVDYSLDIGIYINQGFTYEGTDAREVLVQNSFFVPVKSVPYVFNDGELKLAK